MCSSDLNLKSVIATAIKHGGSNEIATATATANAIPKADSSGKLDTWISDGSTSVKGKLQLALTGTQDAGKVPKATAAEIAALLTAGGYSIAPATGSDNLDNIADGSTYKRIAAAVATALNAGTYDAPKCTAFGIGTQTPPTMATSVDNYRTNGIFKDPGSLTNSPFGTHQAKILVLSQDATHCSQLAFRYGSGAGAVCIKVRNWNGASWGEGWKDVWTSDSDGNGGQPPAPKPANSTSSIFAGNFKAVNSAGSGAAISFPNEGGQWVAVVFCYLWSAATIYTPFEVVFGAGNTQIKAGISGAGWTSFCWKITA